VLERKRAMHGRVRGVGPLAHGSSESRNMSAIAARTAPPQAQTAMAQGHG